MSNPIPRFPDLPEANRRYGQVFLMLAQRSADTVTFRRLTEIGMPHAQAHQTDANRRFVERMEADGDLEKFFMSREAALQFFGGTDGLAASLTTNQIAAYQRSVDTASIVFAHSAVDAAVSELCWITAFVRPSDWDKFLEPKKVTIADAKARPQ